MIIQKILGTSGSSFQIRICYISYGIKVVRVQCNKTCHLDCGQEQALGLKHTTRTRRSSSCTDAKNGRRAHLLCVGAQDPAMHE
jgi:hypothetical protein